MPIPHSQQGHASNALHSTYTTTTNNRTRTLLSPPFTTRRSLGVLPSEYSTAHHEAVAMAAVTRHSAPNFSRDSVPSVAARDAPESVLMRTNVRVAGLATQDAHCVYLLEVDVGFATHVLPKRFSELRAFRTELLHVLGGTKKTKKSKTTNTSAPHGHCGHGPCTQLVQLSQIQFPRRRLHLSGMKREADFDLAHQRVTLLERFLQSMLRVYRMANRRQMRACANSRCAVLDMIQRFLEVAEPVLTVKHDLDPACDDCETTRPVRGRKEMPHRYPELAYSTLCGDMPAPLYAIAETTEPTAVSD